MCIVWSVSTKVNTASCPHIDLQYLHSFVDAGVSGNGNLCYCNKDPLEEVQGTGWRHAGHAGAVDGTEMDPGHVEAEGR